MKRINLLLAGLFLLASCSSLPDWLGSDNDKVTLKGERVAVMNNSVKITPNPDIQNDAIDIPPAVNTPSMGQHVGNFFIQGDLKSVQTENAGDEPEHEFFLSFPPAVEGNTIYVIDGHSNIGAYDADTLKEKWRKKTIAGKKDRDLPGGGITVAYSVLYAATGYGEVVAVSATDGTVVWQKSLGAPLRRPPIVVNDKVFAVTIDNQLFALSVIDGTTLWRHSGVRESTSFYGSSGIGIKGDILVAAYSSGEVFGINAPRGNELWTELVSLNQNHESAASNLNDVSATPVIVDGLVYIGSNSGDLTAFNATSGAMVWRQKLGSVTATPWVAGRYIFAVAGNENLVALDRISGKVRWVVSLPQSSKLKKRSFYAGPVMASGKLVIVSSRGKLLEYDPADGRAMQTINIPKQIFSVPAIANGKLYLLTSKSQLVVVK